MEKDLLHDSRKIQPRLRMVADGSTGVNAVRAELSGSVMLPEKALADIPLKCTAEAQRNAVAATSRRTPSPPVPESLTRLAKDVLVSVFVEVSSTTETKLPGERARRGNLIVATLPVDEINALTKRPEVVHVQMGQPLKAPQPERERAPVEPPEDERKFGDSKEHKLAHERVLVGIIDVEGFDFGHPDFLDADGNTRWVSIWDQGGSNRPHPSTPGCDRGSEILAVHMNAALANARSTSGFGVPASELEPQSQMSEGSHGTHVASIAAGNRGVCRQAEIAGVLLSLPSEDFDRRKSFYDSTSIAHAVDFLLDVAAKRHKQCVINVSLGTNGHAHDGSAAISRWIDAAMSIPGRAICVAAGNAGQEVAEFEGDTGYALGRIHTSGRLPSAGLVTNIEWVVAGNGIIDLSENELELWFSPQDQMDVFLKPPGATEFIGPVGPNQFIQNRQLKDGSFFSVYNELYHPANGANYVAIYLSPRMSENEPLIGVCAGTWIVRLHGRDIRDGRYHGWIERDDPRPLGRTGERAAWNFPSFFSQRSNVDNASVSSLACGNRVICVANYDRVQDRIGISSSQGPTRDNRFKPDVATPGTDIIAASGFTGPDELWVSMTGTSMAAPFATGVAGLMLAVEPRLTAAQIEGIIHRTATPLPGANHEWNDSAGFGVIDPKACLAEAARAMQREEVTK